MRQASRPPKTPSGLSDSVHGQLNMYALAAGAAGVGVLALAQPAEAKIIYSPKDCNIVANSTCSLRMAGQTAFLLFANTSYPSSRGWSSLAAQGKGNNRVEGGRGLASALYAGAFIGPQQNFSGRLLEHCRFGPDGEVCSGIWYYKPTASYLGLKIYIHGKAHYGWARLTIMIPRDTYLSGYAYETIPNKAIIAGKTKGRDVITVQPGSLGHLAAGASAIPAWRSGK
jgi:hypothetical protein